MFISVSQSDISAIFLMNFCDYFIWIITVETLPLILIVNSLTENKYFFNAGKLKRNSEHFHKPLAKIFTARVGCHVVWRFKCGHNLKFVFEIWLSFVRLSFREQLYDTMSFDDIKNEPSVSGIGSVTKYSGTSEEEDDDDDDKSYVDPENHDDPENYEDELESYLSESVPLGFGSHVGKQKKHKKDHSKIPVHLKGLMGEANLRFARGEHDVAEKMCFEIIRQVPMAHEPYMTLWQIHENSPQKSIQYLTMAAHLRSQEDDLWNKLGQLYIDSGNLKQAVSCYNKAIQANSDNMEYHLKRIQLLQQLGMIFVQTFTQLLFFNSVFQYRTFIYYFYTTECSSHSKFMTQLCHKVKLNLFSRLNVTYISSFKTFSDYY